MWYSGVEEIYEILTDYAECVGHESIDITYNYAHLFPSKQAEMADKLNFERGINDVSKES